MASVEVRKVKDLDDAARTWLSRLFGRPVADDENVAVLLLPDQAGSTATDRRETAARMEELFRSIDSRTARVPADEIDEAVDEAFQQIRRWRD